MNTNSVQYRIQVSVFVKVESTSVIGHNLYRAKPKEKITRGVCLPGRLIEMIHDDTVILNIQYLPLKHLKYVQCVSLILFANKSIHFVMF